MAFRQQVLALKVRLDQLPVALPAEGSLAEQHPIGADAGHFAGFDQPFRWARGLAE